MENKKITVEFEVNEYSNDGLVTLLRAIAYCGNVGASRELKYFCDGDGSSPQIKRVLIDGKDVAINQLPGSEKWREMID